MGMVRTGQVRSPARDSRPPPAIAYRIGDRVYLNVTSRCTLRCRFCPKFQGLWTVADRALRMPISREPSVAEIIAAARAQGPCVEYVFCGLGEPTLRIATVLAAASVLRATGIPIRLNTDGLGSLVHGRNVAAELDGLIDRVSISLNAADEASYERWCRPRRPDSYPAMLAFAAACRDFVPKVTLSAVAGLAGVDIAACADIAARLNVEFRARPLESTDGRSFRVR